MNNNKTAFYLLLLFFCVLKFILQYVLINPVFELHRDEFLHLDQANHLSWGYFSVPPFSSWVALIIKALGNSIFWVKFFPALFGCITIYFSFKIILEIGGSIFSLFLAGVALTFSALLRINMLFQPNSADIMFWTMTYYFLIQYLNRKTNMSLIWLGVSIGLGILNKYSILFLVAGLIPAILLSKHRQIFFNRYFYVACSISLLILLPNVIWQIANNFPVIAHMKELSRTQLVNVNRFDFLKEQALFFFNSLFIIIAALVGVIFSNKLRYYRFIILSYIFTIGIFLISRGKAYYALGLYPVLISLGSVYLEINISQNWFNKIRYVLPVAVIALFIPVINFVFPVQPPQVMANSQRLLKMGMLKWEDGKDHHLPQDFADMLGWKEMAGIVAEAKKKLPPGEHTLIRTENYGQAGAINFYSDNLNALSYNADYLRWFPADKNFRHVILIREPGSEPSAKERELFEEKIYVGKVENKFAREYGTYVYILKNAKSNIAPIIETEVKSSMP